MKGEGERRGLALLHDTHSPCRSVMIVAQRYALTKPIGFSPHLCTEPIKQVCVCVCVCMCVCLCVRLNVGACSEHRVFVYESFLSIHA